MTNWIWAIVLPLYLQLSTLIQTDNLKVWHASFIWVAHERCLLVENVRSKAQVANNTTTRSITYTSDHDKYWSTKIQIAPQWATVVSSNIQLYMVDKVTKINFCKSGRQLHLPTYTSIVSIYNLSQTCKQNLNT